MAAKLTLPSEIFRIAANRRERLIHRTFALRTLSLHFSTSPFQQLHNTLSPGKLSPVHKPFQNAQRTLREEELKKAKNISNQLSPPIKTL